MQFSGIIQKARNSSFNKKDPGKELRQLREAIEELKEKLPLIGWVITRTKHYSGRIEKLEIKGVHSIYLFFSITDCDRNGKSLSSAKTYERKIRLEELEDLQV